LNILTPLHSFVVVGWGYGDLVFLAAATFGFGEYDLA